MRGGWALLALAVWGAGDQARGGGCPTLHLLLLRFPLLPHPPHPLPHSK